MKAVVLRKEISDYITKQQKINRKLAKDIAAWVDTALTKSANVSREVDDIAILDDEDNDFR